MAVVAVLMAVQKVLQPRVGGSVLNSLGGGFTIPMIVLVVLTRSVAAGYWFGLAGALRARTSVDVPVAALVTWTLTDYPIAVLRAGRHRGRPVSIDGLCGSARRTRGLLGLARLGRPSQAARTGHQASGPGGSGRQTVAARGLPGCGRLRARLLRAGVRDLGPVCAVGADRRGHWLRA